MRIDDDVGALPALCEWHIHFRNNVANGSLLPVTTTEFIPDDRLAKCANANFANDVSVPVALRVILVDVAVFCCPVHFTCVFVFDYFCVVVPVFLDGHDLAHNNVTIFNDGIFRNNALAIQFRIISKLHSLCFGGIRPAANFLVAVDFLVLVLFGVINGRAEQTAVDCALVYKDAVFLIITGVAHNCNDDGCAGWNLVELYHAHDAGINQRTHWVR